MTVGQKVIVCSPFSDEANQGVISEVGSMSNVCVVKLLDKKVTVKGVIFLKTKPRAFHAPLHYCYPYE